jgi:hypothetical protein
MWNEPPYYNRTCLDEQKMVEFYNKHNAIIEIKIGDDDSFYIKQVRKYDMQQPDKSNNNT